VVGKQIVQVHDAAGGAVRQAEIGSPSIGFPRRKIGPATPTNPAGLGRW
jgi:hypothetical protein